MAIKAKGTWMTFGAPTGKQVANATPIGPHTFKPGVLQDPVHQIQRTFICGCDRGASDQISCQLDWINRRGHGRTFLSGAQTGSNK